MAHRATHFSPELEAQFRASRVAAVADLNTSVSHFGMSAAMVLLFSLWDWYVDPAAWRTALLIRIVAVAVIVATGIIQRQTGTLRWAPLLAKIRYASAILAIAGANAVIHNGYVVGLAGLVAAFLGGPYIVVDRRDYFLTTIWPLAGVAVAMYLANLDRFVIINASVFLALTIAVGSMLVRVFESTNRRAFAAEQALMREARTDALTGLANRRSMEETAAGELHRQGRTGKPTAVILCDVDHFKRINDELGHDVGDETICAVAEQLRSVMRNTDTLSRWGGDEFLAILPETSEAAARELAERMRQTVASAHRYGGSGTRVTVSLGVAATAVRPFAATADTFASVLKSADAALYEAKAAGRNRVVSASFVHAG